MVFRTMPPAALRRDVDTEAGFTLVEALISTVITMVGVLAIATVFIYGIRLQSGASDGSRAMNLAVAELERLRMLPVSAAERADGGSLTANQADHFVIRNNITVRWTVADGRACGPSLWAGPTLPVECTKDVSIVALAPNTFAVQASIDGQLWR